MTRFISLMIILTSFSTAFSQQEAAAPLPDVPQTRLIGIILVQGSNTPIEENLALPTKAKKVIEEVADFLPFKHFSMLDSSFIRTDHRASFKLRGPGGKELIANMGIESHPSDENTILIDNFGIEEVSWNIEGEKKSRFSKYHITTSFSIKSGETIVVGTSRINYGDDSIIVLFSAG